MYNQQTRAGSTGPFESSMKLKSKPFSETRCNLSKRLNFFIFFSQVPCGFTAKRMEKRGEKRREVDFMKEINFQMRIIKKWAF
jgi:hypothetical protein